MQCNVKTEQMQQSIYKFLRNVITKNPYFPQNFFFVHANWLCLFMGATFPIFDKSFMQLSNVLCKLKKLSSSKNL